MSDKNGSTRWRGPAVNAFERQIQAEDSGEMFTSDDWVFLRNAVTSPGIVISTPPDMITTNAVVSGPSVIVDPLLVEAASAERPAQGAETLRLSHNEMTALATGSVVRPIGTPETLRVVSGRAPTRPIRGRPHIVHMTAEERHARRLAFFSDEH